MRDNHLIGIEPADSLHSVSIAIATPSLRETFTGYYIRSVFDLQRWCATAGVRCELLMEGGVSLVAHARNRLAKRFIYETDCSHLLFIDDDIGFDASHVLDMLRWSSLPVIGALYPRREIDWKTVKRIVERNPHIDPDDIATCAASYDRNVGWISTPLDIETITTKRPFEVSFIATGLMLVSRDCLMKVISEQSVKRYHFGELMPDELKLQGNIEFFKSLAGEDGILAGEDTYFCQLIKDIGLPIHAYGAIHVVHSGIANHFGYPEIKKRYGMPLI